MKLFNRYNRINLLVVSIIFILASVAFYFFIHFTLINQVDDSLKMEYGEIKTYAKEHNILPEIIKVDDQHIRYTLIDTSYSSIVFKTFNGYDSLEKVEDKFREIEFGIHVAGKNYKVTVAKSLESTNHLLQSILLISITTILIMLLVSFFINRIVLKRLWKPFYQTLNKLNLFSLSKNEKLKFEPIRTDEFTLLNATLEKVTQNAQQDYVLLKEFTENASHEMQTPLAIVRSKLDLLIQDEHLSESQSVTVQNVYTSIDKLSRLNQSLLLMAKIGNRQFATTTNIDFTAFIKEKLNAFQELWASRDISVSTSLAPAVIAMNQQLAEILLNNLLSNATKHNYQGGRINIQLFEKMLVVINSSHGPALDPHLMFTRFYTPAKGMTDHGLGLSIIKQITDISGIKIDYSFHENMHSFTLKW